jgi:hypothetical protein
MTQRSKRAMAVIVTWSALLLLAKPAGSSENNIETIAFVRHGEKPVTGLGQLSCQGLNRALVLPSVIAKVVGKPEFILAPDPSVQKKDAGTAYDYVRPLATIEPTAISFGLPIHASIGVFDTDGLRTALEQPQHRNAVILVAWEHEVIETTVRAILASYGGDVSGVPKWRGDDFDSIYVLTISRTESATTASFVLKHEALDGQPDICPH